VFKAKAGPFGVANTSALLHAAKLISAIRTTRIFIFDLFLDL
jgi:hypothetical protein